MQRSMLAALCAGVALMTAVSAHATNVAVADTQAAFLASNFAKKTVDDLNATLKPQRDKLEQLRAQLQALEARFEKDGKVMTDADRKALQAQAQSKMNEYTSTARGVQRRIEETQATMEKAIRPKVEKIIQDLRKEGKYDIIIERRNVVWAEPAVDITTKITERLNATP